MESSYLPDAAAIVRTVAALRARNIDVIVADTRAAAQHALIELLPDGAEICDSTSETLEAIGFTAFVRGNPRYTNLHDVYEAEPDLTRRQDLRRRASIADYFIGSVQAIAETGEIFVASSTGSQIAPYVYAARRVILVVGTQKIVPTFDAAMQRVRGPPWSDMTSGWQGWGGPQHPLASWGLLNMKARRDG